MAGSGGDGVGAGRRAGRALRGGGRKRQKRRTMALDLRDADVVETIDYFKRVGVTRNEVDAFYRVFLEVNHGSKAMKCAKLSALFRWAGVRSSRFAESLFTLVDEDCLKTGVDFRTFSIGLWNFLSLDEEHVDCLSNFFYDLTCTTLGLDGLDAGQVIAAIQDLHLGEFESEDSRLEQLYEFWDVKDAAASDQDAKLRRPVSRRDFLRMVHTHRIFIFPMVVLQRDLRRCVVNGQFWDGQREQRRQMFGKIVDIWTLLDADPDEIADLLAQIKKGQDPNYGTGAIVPEELVSVVSRHEYKVYVDSKKFAMERRDWQRKRDAREQAEDEEATQALRREKQQDGGRTKHRGGAKRSVKFDPGAPTNSATAEDDTAGSHPWGFITGSTRRRRGASRKVSAGDGQQRKRRVLDSRIGPLERFTGLSMDRIKLPKLV